MIQFIKMSSGGHGYIFESDASVRFIVTDTAVDLCHYSAFIIPILTSQLAWQLVVKSKI